MIGFNQAENLFVFAKRNHFPGIYAELQRIGFDNLKKLLGSDQQCRLIHYMAGNNPKAALELLSNYPSKEE